jgi:hypothetical protein
MGAIKQTGKIGNFAIDRVNFLSGHALAPVIWFTSFSYFNTEKQDLGPVCYDV